MIRKATKDDIPYILEMEKSNFTFPRLSIDINDFIVDDMLRGYADMHIVIDEGYIGNIFVDEKYRRQGIATELISYLNFIAKESKLSFITLEVRQSNYPAIELYKKSGFSLEGLLKKHYSDPSEDGLIYTKREPF